VSNDYTNPNTNARTLTALLKAFVRRYFVTLYGTTLPDVKGRIVTSIKILTTACPVEGM